MAPDTVEFSLGWKKSLLTLLLVLPMPVMWMLLFPLMMPGEFEVRWTGAALLVPVAALVVAFQLRARTTLTREGIIGREVGRPWRLLARTMIPWQAVRAVEGRKLGTLVSPVVHLTDGGAVRLRVPAERSYAEMADRIATFQQWQIESTGIDPGQITVPPRLPPLSRRRRVLVPLAAIAVVVVDLFVLVAVFVNEFDRPPEVYNCPLVPLDLTMRITPGAPPKGLGNGEAKRGDSCMWQVRAAKGQISSISLTLGVMSASEGYIRSSYPDDLAKDRAQHVVHPIPGIRGHSWALLDTGRTNAQALAVTGGYRIRVELNRYDSVLTEATAEQQVADVVRAVVGKLEVASS